MPFILLSSCGTYNNGPSFVTTQSKEVVSQLQSYGANINYDSKVNQYKTNLPPIVLLDFFEIMGYKVVTMAPHNAEDYFNVTWTLYKELQ